MSMWLEARKQERKIRTVMVDHKKRLERRREFYERIRREPSEFMQVHGNRCKIHMDADIARRAEQSCIPWSGDRSILIDRNDVRSMLDGASLLSSNRNKNGHEISPSEETEELLCNYERYRVLAVNAFQKVHEEKFLKHIYAMEHCMAPPVHKRHALAKQEEQKKKQLQKGKAAIAFRYDDGGETTIPKTLNQSDESESATSEEEDEEDIQQILQALDIKLEVTELSPLQQNELNRIGDSSFGIKHGHFVKLMWDDKAQVDNLKEIKLIEDAKAQMAGKYTRRERQILKQKGLLMRGKIAVDGSGATTTLFALASADTERQRHQSSGSSPDPLADKQRRKRRRRHPDDDSGSESDERASSVKEQPAQFITSFGGDEPQAPASALNKTDISATSLEGDTSTLGEVEDEATMVVQGPALPPPGYQKLLELRNKRSASPDFGSRLSGENRSRSRTDTQRHSRRYSRRSRSRSNRRESRERRRDTDERRRSSRDRRTRRRSSSSTRDRRRRQDVRRRSRSRTRHQRDTRTRRRSSSSDEAPSKPVVIAHDSTTTDTAAEKRSSVTDDAQRSAVADRSTFGNDNASSSGDSGSEGELVELSVHSSMSEDEQTRRLVENRRRRVTRTKRALKRAKKDGTPKEEPSTSSVQSADKTPKLSVGERLRLQALKKLKKTFNQDKLEQQAKRHEHAREKYLREEELREISEYQREKERLKRRRERDGGNDEHDRLAEKERRRRHHRTPSPPKTTRSRSRSGD